MKAFFITLTMLVLLCPSALAAEKLVFATTVWPPYQYEENGQLTGITADIVREAARRLNIELEIQVLPWKRALRDVKEGYANGMLSALHTEERSQFMYYTSLPLFSVRTVIFGKKEKQIKITGLDDLKNKSIGVVVGYSYGPEFDNYPGLKKQECREDRELVRILDKGRIDVAVAHEGPFMFTAKQSGLRNRFEAVYILNENPSYLTFSKSLGDKGKALSEKFSQVLEKLKAEGVIDQIIENYF
jgi:polar amino acid transport system substrate-binding protein